MKIKNKYYRLLFDKEMSDGTVIKKDQNLIFLKEDEDGLFFMELNEESCKKVFWISQDDILFLREDFEDFSEEEINKRISQINSGFL